MPQFSIDKEYVIRAMSNACSKYIFVPSKNSQDRICACTCLLEHDVSQTQRKCQWSRSCVDIEGMKHLWQLIMQCGHSTNSNLPCRMKIYTEFNFANWLRLVKFLELNISKFWFLNFNYISYHLEISKNKIISGI